MRACEYKQFKAFFNFLLSFIIIHKLQIKYGYLMIIFFHNCSRRLLSIEKVSESVYGTPIFILSLKKRQLPVLLNLINRHSFYVYTCISKFKLLKRSPAEYFILLLAKNIYVTTNYYNTFLPFSSYYSSAD
jgi:hypothetical protein